MRNRILSVSILGGLLAGIASGAAAPAGGPATQPLSTQPAVHIIELRGDGTSIGLQHGRQLGPDVRLLQEKYLEPWFGTTQQYRAALEVAGAFGNFLLPRHQAEIQALAQAADVDPKAVLLANCFLDIAPVTACSTITLPASAAPDRVARFGRTLDFPSMDIADRHTVLLVVHPKEGYAFATITWPGLIGVLSGMNEHGLTLTNMEVSRSQGSPRAMPYMLLYRTVLEECRTVDEAIALLGKTPRQSANNLMLMDAAGSRAVVEITPDKIAVRRAPPGAALISTNHQRGQDLDTPGRCDRFDTLHETAAAQFGRIDVPAIQKMLNRVSQGNLTMQAMVFEPAHRVIYLASGSQAAKRPYQRIELARYFGN